MLHRAAFAGILLLLGVSTPGGFAGSSAGLMTAAHAAPASVTDAQLRGFLSRWLAAQNKHDFTRYSRMYAADFTGIKRTTSGRTREYDRAGWLADRRPMMAPSRHLHLSAENVRYRRLQGGWAEIRFDQHFRTKNYGDWGPKLLRVRRTASGIQIVHEELLAAHSVPTADCC